MVVGAVVDGTGTACCKWSIPPGRVALDARDAVWRGGIRCRGRQLVLGQDAPGRARRLAVPHSLHRRATSRHHYLSVLPAAGQGWRPAGHLARADVSHRPRGLWRTIADCRVPLSGAFHRVPRHPPCGLSAGRFLQRPRVGADRARSIRMVGIAAPRPDLARSVCLLDALFASSPCAGNGVPVVGDTVSRRGRRAPRDARSLDRHGGVYRHRVDWRVLYGGARCRAGRRLAGDLPAPAASRLACAVAARPFGHPRRPDCRL